MPEQGPRAVPAAKEWEIDLDRRELRSRGVSVPIGSRAFEILEVLVESGGELVNKYDLIDRVWPGAAGCARSRFQSVSVVPINQWFFHGITNSTELSVRRIRPASPVMRSRGTTMCTPLEARTRNRPRAPDRA